MSRLPRVRYNYNLCSKAFVPSSFMNKIGDSRFGFVPIFMLMDIKQNRLPLIYSYRFARALVGARTKENSHLLAYSNFIY